LNTEVAEIAEALIRTTFTLDAVGLLGRPIGAARRIANERFRISGDRSSRFDGPFQPRCGAASSSSARSTLIVASREPCLSVVSVTSVV